MKLTSSSNPHAKPDNSWFVDFQSVGCFDFIIEDYMQERRKESKASES